MLQAENSNITKHMDQQINISQNAARIANVEK